MGEICVWVGLAHGKDSTTIPSLRKARQEKGENREGKETQKDEGVRGQTDGEGAVKKKAGKARKEQNGKGDPEVGDADMEQGESVLGEQEGEEPEEE